MHIELTPTARSKHIQVSCSDRFPLTRFSDPAPFRVVVVFTTVASARDGLRVAQRLAGSELAIWFVCPIAQTFAGRIWLQRFMQFVFQCADSLPASVLAQTRFFVYPSAFVAKAVDDFSSQRSVVLAASRWWHRWGGPAADGYPDASQRVGRNSVRTRRTPKTGQSVRVWVRAVMFFIAVAGVISLGWVYRVMNTITTLDRVERERDLWQRPADVLSALELGPASVVVDLGSGAGYFALRLSSLPSGRVFAVDIRKDSLFFLRVRALLDGRQNLTTIRARAEDLSLSPDSVDAALIANTYHEFGDRNAALRQALLCLKRGGRLVILDHEQAAEPRASLAKHGHHHISMESAERDLAHASFAIRQRQPRFITAEGGEIWWLLTAHRPL